jgi:hypothetical protein
MNKHLLNENSAYLRRNFEFTHVYSHLFVVENLTATKSVLGLGQDDSRFLHGCNLCATNTAYVGYVPLERDLNQNGGNLMADVYAVFGTLIALGIAYPGLLSAWRMIFPGFVERAQNRILNSAWATFGIGAGVGLPVILFSIFLISIPAPLLRFIGAALAIFALSIASIGAAGLAGAMGARLNDLSGGRYSIPGAQMRGAVALELAAIFPLIGWLLVFPLGTLTCFGAGLHALISRQEAPETGMDMAVPQAGEV